MRVKRLFNPLPFYSRLFMLFDTGEWVSSVDVLHRGSTSQLSDQVERDSSTNKRSGMPL